jgi:hypothetical protein
MEWMTLYKMHLIYHPKDIGTFRSACWQKDYTPDLSMMTQESADEEWLSFVGFLPNSLI